PCCSSGSHRCPRQKRQTSLRQFLVPSVYSVCAPLPRRALESFCAQRLVPLQVCEGQVCFGDRARIRCSPLLRSAFPIHHPRLSARENEWHCTPHTERRVWFCSFE